MAEAKGIELSAVTGTGPNGRIIKADIEEHKGTAPAAVQAPAAIMDSAPGIGYTDI